MNHRKAVEERRRGRARGPGRSTSCRPWGDRLPRAAAIILAAAAAVMLAGCGDVSLLANLKSEHEALPLSVGPEDPHVPAKAAVTLTVSGGVAPYEYLLSGPGELAEGPQDLDAATVTYLAPQGIAAEVVEATVRVTDFVGRHSQSRIRIHLPLEVDPERGFSLYRDQTRPVQVSGGVKPYTATPRSGTGEFVSPSSYLYYSPADNGHEDSLLIRDAVGNQRILVVTVVDPPTNGDIMLDPPSATVGQGGAVSFVVTGGSGAYTIAQDPEGPDNGVTAPPAVSEGETVAYTAPGIVTTDLEVEIEVTDSDTGKSAVFTVVVLSSPPPLTVTFNGGPPTAEDQHVQLGPGDTIEIKAARGVPPYTFVLVPDHSRTPGTLVPEDPPVAAVYTGPQIVGNPPLVFERIEVGDSGGSAKVTQRVKVMR